MSLEDEVYEKATIRFPRPIGLREAEELLEYVSQELPGQIHISAAYSAIIGTRFSSEETQGRTSVSLSGTMNRKGENYAFDSFRLHNVDSNPMEFDAFAFNVIPGYSLGEHRLAVIMLWDDARGCVDKYFNSPKV